MRRPGWGSGTADHTRIDLPPLDAQRVGEAAARPSRQGRAAAARSRRGRVRADARQSRSSSKSWCACFTPTAPCSRGVDGGKWRVDSQRALEATLPMSVEEAIQARIASLSPIERELLEKAATLGIVFWLGALVVLSRLEERASGEQHLRRRGARAHRGGARGAGRARLSAQDAGLDGAGRGRVHLQAQPRARSGAQAGAARARAPLLPRRRRVARDARLPADEREQSGEQLEHQATLYEQGRQSRARRRALHRRRRQGARALRQRRRRRACTRTASRSSTTRTRWRGSIRCTITATCCSAPARRKEALAAFEKMLAAAWRLDYTAKAGAAHGRIARAHRALGDYDTAEEHLDQRARRCSARRATRAASPASRTISGASRFCAAPIRKRSSVTAARSICGARSAKSARWRCRCTTWRWCTRRRARTPRR